MTKRDSIWFALLAVVLLIAGTAWLLMPPNRSVGKAMFGVGTPGSSWSREVRYSVDGPGEIASKETTATITFSEGKLVVEKSRVLFNDREVAKLAEDAKVVEANYSAGQLTVTADGSKVHETKLSE